MLRRCCASFETNPTENINKTSNRRNGEERVALPDDGRSPSLRIQDLVVPPRVDTGRSSSGREDSDLAYPKGTVGRRVGLLRLCLHQTRHFIGNSPFRTHTLLGEGEQSTHYSVASLQKARFRLHWRFEELSPHSGPMLRTSIPDALTKSHFRSHVSHVTKIQAFAQHQLGSVFASYSGCPHLIRPQIDVCRRVRPILMFLAQCRIYSSTWAWII